MLPHAKKREAFLGTPDPSSAPSSLSGATPTRHIPPPSELHRWPRGWPVSLDPVPDRLLDDAEFPGDDRGLPAGVDHQLHGQSEWLSARKGWKWIWSRLFRETPASKGYQSMSFPEDITPIAERIDLLANHRQPFDALIPNSRSVMGEPEPNVIAVHPVVCRVRRLHRITLTWPRLIVKGRTSRESGRGR